MCNGCSAARPKTYKYSEELLADKELDAVMIGTGDHQHARILAEVVRAGKDCYCEKPMANTLEDAKLARDTVKASKQVVQMGSQWLSDPYQQQVREIVRSGKLGKIVSISQSWNFNGPRWHVPKNPNVAAIREQDTDWKRWLLGRPVRPFDPARVLRVPHLQGFLRRHHRPVVQPRLRAGALLPGYVHSGRHGVERRHFRLARCARESGHVPVRLHLRRKAGAVHATARRSATGTAITRSSAARAARCTRRAARAVRSGGSLAEPHSGWRSNVVFDTGKGNSEAEPVTTPGRSERRAGEQRATI